MQLHATESAAILPPQSHDRHQNTGRRGWVHSPDLRHSWAHGPRREHRMLRKRRQVALGATLDGSISDAALDPEDLDPMVSQVMNRDVLCLPANMQVRDAIQIFLTNGISGAPVVDEDGKLVGVLSETDIISSESGSMGSNTSEHRVPLKYLTYLDSKTIALDREREKIRALLDRPVHEFMTKDPFSVQPEAQVVQAAALMIEKQVNRLPVCSNNRVVGILTRGDVLQCMIWEMLMAGSKNTEDS